VIIRATVGALADSSFEEDIAGAIDSGMHVGVYHAFIPGINGIEQANMLMKTVGEWRDQLRWIAVDVEIAGSRLEARLMDFLVQMRTFYHITPIIYTGAWFWDSNLPNFQLMDHQWWIASYGTNQPILPKRVDKALLHQYSSSGKVAGINSRVDLNRFV